MPRFRQLPDGRPAHVTDLYTAEELKTSPTYNEMLPRAGCQDGLNARLDGPDGSHITWGLGDPVTPMAGGLRGSRWSRGYCPISGSSSGSGRRWSAPKRGTRP